MGAVSNCSAAIVAGCSIECAVQAVDTGAGATVVAGADTPRVVGSLELELHVQTAFF